MITKKQFIKIAEVFSNYKPVDIRLINELMDIFENINPNFNRSKFIHACHNPKNKKVA